MDATVITTAEALGMSASADNNMYTAYNTEHTEGVAVFFDSASCQYVVKHFVHLNDGRTATFNDKVTDDVEDVIHTMKEYYEEFMQEQEKAHDIFPLIGLTSKTTEELIHRWKKSEYSSAISNGILKSLEDIRKASTDIFMEAAEMYALSLRK